MFLCKNMQNPYVIVSVVDGLNIITIYEVSMILKNVFYPYKSQKPTHLQYLKKTFKRTKFLSLPLVFRSVSE